MLVLGAPTFYRRYYPRDLRDHFEMVFCDLRQWVPSPPGFDVAMITRDTFSDDVEAIRADAGLDRPIVMGQSQHGAIALEYAQRYPEHVRGVAAIGAVPPAGSADGLRTHKEFFRVDASVERQAAHQRNKATFRVPTTVDSAQDFIDVYVSDAALNWYDPTFDCTALWEGVEANMPVEWQVFAPECYGGYRIGRMDTPVFLALGRYDYVVPYPYWEKPATKMSHLRYQLYDRSGHHPPYEQPAEFTADLLDWAAGLK